jgi:hypothetical protein
MTPGDRSVERYFFGKRQGRLSEPSQTVLGTPARAVSASRDKWDGLGRAAPTWITDAGLAPLRDLR